MAATPANQQTLDKYAGFALIACAAAALLAANGPFADGYQQLLHWKFGPPLPRAGQFDFHHWVADGLMAVFFLLVGLEVKREWFEGRLSSAAERRLPIIAAVSGMAVPALIFLAVVGWGSELAQGWAIPAATDIGFAIGVLAILGRHAPPSIKLLLVTIAIVDDIGAVLIIALFYTADLNILALASALVLTASMFALGKFGVRSLAPFLASFVLVWLLVLASGVHATVAGVLAALTIPLGSGEEPSPLKKLEHAIHPWVMFAIVPLFGFVSAGVALEGSRELIQPLPLAVFAGLFLGKQLGIFGAIWAAVGAGFAARPLNTGWQQLYGGSLLCGIGFTMSLFIGGLAFPGNDALVDQAKVGTLAGSLLSAMTGYAMLRLAPATGQNEADVEDATELFGADQYD